MTVLFGEMTREQIRTLAPTGLAILPTASIEQHGPHMAVSVDTVLCSTVAQLSAERAAAQIPVVVTPTLCFGNSHHHFPFAGVLSLTSENYYLAVTDVVEGLIKSGFRKILILNGHGGNTDSNRVVGLDIANLRNHPVNIAAAAYWDVARPAIVSKGLMASERIPGHAGRFETSLMMAIRPDLVFADGLAQTEDVSKKELGLMVPLTGATVQVHGAWGEGPGYSDEPAAASAAEGKAMLDVIVEEVANLLVNFYKMGG
jgi:creatinine amidohydrolase